MKASLAFQEPAQITESLAVFSISFTARSLLRRFRQRQGVAQTCSRPLDSQTCLDQSAGRLRISTNACNRVESAAFSILAAPFFNDGARFLSFASSLRLS